MRLAQARSVGDYTPGFAPVPVVRRPSATPRRAEPAWHRAARRQRAQDRALVFLAKAAHRLDAHHGSQSGMAWDTVGKKKDRKPSLNAWLRDQGFADEVVQAVQQSKLSKTDIERLTDLRRQARGDGGKLSRAQCHVLQPAKVKFSGGKLLNLKIDGTPGGERRRVVYAMVRQLRRML